MIVAKFTSKTQRENGITISSGGYGCTLPTCFAYFILVGTLMRLSSAFSLSKYVWGRSLLIQALCYVINELVYLMFLI